MRTSNRRFACRFKNFFFNTLYKREPLIPDNVRPVIGLEKHVARNLASNTAKCRPQAAARHWIVFVEVGCESCVFMMFCEHVVDDQRIVFGKLFCRRRTEISLKQASSSHFLTRARVIAGA
jgi:hypothetical protein